jgi:hypothetical protein
VVAVNELSFQVRFHGPFRVGTGRGRDGVDAAIDLDDPLPASHLKGLMRASARALLPPVDPLLDQVFGAGRDRGNSPWAWDSAHPASGSWREMTVRNTVRISIDDDCGTAVPDHLLVGAQLWPDVGLRATFTITRAGAVPAAALPRHEAMLRLAARATTALGAQRRRGLGWITIRPDDGDDRERATADVRLALGREVV